MKTYNAKVFAEDGYIVNRFAKVTIDDECVLIGHSTYPIADVEIDYQHEVGCGRIHHSSGWYVDFTLPNNKQEKEQHEPTQENSGADTSAS